MSTSPRLDREAYVVALESLLRECQGALTGPAELRQRIEDTIGRQA